MMGLDSVRLCVSIEPAVHRCESYAQHIGELLLRYLPLKSEFVQLFNQFVHTVNITLYIIIVNENLLFSGEVS